MAYGLFNEMLDALKSIAQTIISYQDKDSAKRLDAQLFSVNVARITLNGTVAVFELPGLRSRDEEISRTLDVEARLKDKSGNALHAIVYVDEQDNLLALEVFPWDEWSDRVDIKSLEPADFDEKGISDPTKPGESK